VSNGFSRRTVGRICTTGSPDHLSTCSACHCKRCCFDSTELTAVICETVICERLTSAFSAPASRATVATVTAASRYTGDTLITKNIRSQPTSAAATSDGRARSPTTTCAPVVAERLRAFILAVHHCPYGHPALPQQFDDATADTSCASAGAGDEDRFPVSHRPGARPTRARGNHS
jgi:hypothetical protein